MKRYFCTVLATVLLLALSSTAWAGGGHHKYNRSKKADRHHYYQLIRERIHQIRINYQFGAIKHMYDKSDPDARQLFLDYLGMSLPSADEQIQAIKEEYEQKLAERDDTIAALQQQIDELAGQMSAACDARLAEEQEAWQSDLQQQLNAQYDAHQAALSTLTAQLEADCTDRLEQAYADWQASAGDQCAASGLPEQLSFFNTGNVSPYAIDTGSLGNIYVLDRDNLTITIFDINGTVLSQWNPGSFTQPSDIAVDSLGNVYVVDKLAAAPLQKFSPNGAAVPFYTGSTTVIFPSGLFIDSSDNLYVTDYGGSQGGRVLVIDNSGSLVSTFGEEDDLALDEYNDVVVDENNQQIHIVTTNFVANFDMSGAYLGFWEGDFGKPFGIAVGANGDIFIADTYNNEIDQYDNVGNLKSAFAQDSYRPFRIVIDASGKLYVADYGNMQVRIFE